MGIRQPTLDICKKNNIAIASYSPLLPIARHDKGPLVPTIEKLAKKHGVTPAQILLRWQIEKGLIVVTSSSNPERQADQLKLDFQLDPQDVKAIEEEGAAYHFRFFGWGVMAKEYKTPL